VIRGITSWPLAALIFTCACDVGMIDGDAAARFDDDEGGVATGAGHLGDRGRAGDDGEEDDAEGPSFPPAPYPLPTEFDPDDLLDDPMLRGGEAIDVGQMQDFLEEQGSYLAGYEDPSSGRSAAELIVDVSLDHGVSPLYMVARIQTESGLITSGGSSHLSAATGCGCPDGAACDPDLAGFAAQIDCAASVIEAYYDELDADGETRAGWRVGHAKSTLDPCGITPANAATAVLYTYTPWVGAYADGCGRSQYGGSSLVALSYYRFWGAYAWGTAP
jgi:hypothetical protein